MAVYWPSRGRKLVVAAEVAYQRRRARLLAVSTLLKEDGDAQVVAGRWDNGRGLDGVGSSAASKRIS